MHTPRIDRRTFLLRTSGLLAASALGCRDDPASPPVDQGPAELINVTASPPRLTPELGLHAIDFGGLHRGYLFVPSTYRASEPLPLVILLHGAGGSAADWFGSYAGRGEAAGFVLLALDSRAYSWDLFALGGFGPDVRFLESAMAWTFDRCAIDMQRIAMAGFSDGASYALSLGLSNGTLIRHIVAYSPGLVAPKEFRGTPNVLITHGRRDAVLPIGSTSRVIVPYLRHHDIAVEYTEFDGVHEVPAAMSDLAMRWLSAEFSATVTKG